jgi:transposase
MASEPVVAWLQQHPQSAAVSRDRAHNYGEAIRQGAPQAQQIADRWHLLQNLGERVEAFLREHNRALKTPRGDLLATKAGTVGRSAAQEAQAREEHQRHLDRYTLDRYTLDRYTLDRYTQVQEARGRGLNATAIAKLLGISRVTAYK